VYSRFPRRNHPLKQVETEEIEIQDDAIEVIPSTKIDPDNPYESLESELPAEESLHAHPGPKGGRPRKDGIKPGIVETTSHHPIPTPRIRTFKSDSTAPNASSKSAWNYWNTLPTWAKERVVAYVYRDHPILLDPEDMVDEDGPSKPTQFKYIDKIIGTQPIQDDSDLLNRYGCGNYRVTLTDAAPKKKDDRPVCTVWIMNVGGGNYRSNPPTDNRIDDIAQIDLDHPANKSFVSYLRGQGKLPDQLNSKQQENEMANVQLIDKLTDNLLASSKEKNKDTGVLQDAMKGAMEVMQEGAKAAVSITREANEYASKVRDQADSNRPSQVVAPVSTSDPIATAVQLIKTIQEMSGGSNQEVTELRHQLAQMQQSQLESMREQIRLLMDAKVTTPATASSPFSSMNEGLESLRKMKEVVDEFAGAAGEEAASKGNPVTEAIGDAAPKWVRPFIPYAPLLGQLLMGMLQSRMQQPQPQPQYAPPGYPSGPMPGYQPSPQINAPLMPTPQPQPQPTQIDNPNNLPQPVIEVLSGLKDSLAFHMHYEMSGTEFAQWYITQVGEPRYRDVAALGVEQIVQCLALYPPTASVLRNKKTEEVTDFVSEFCAPKWEEGDDEPGKQREV
jgi:hypothetical protein